jgi:hypothetical protein
VLGNYKGFWRAQILEGHGQLASLPRKALALAAAPVVERVAERLLPGSEGFNLPYAERFTRALEIPVICVGGFQSRSRAHRGPGAATPSPPPAGSSRTPTCTATSPATPEPDQPVCGYCNGCIARFGGQPINCYRPEIRARKEAMLNRCFWPASERVGTQIPASWRVDGFPEVRFRSTAAALVTPLHMREVFFDEQNVFDRVLGQPTGPGGGRWWTEGFDDAVGHRVALLLRRRRSVRGRALRRLPVVRISS